MRVGPQGWVWSVCMVRKFVYVWPIRTYGYGRTDQSDRLVEQSNSARARVVAGKPVPGGRLLAVHCAQNGYFAHLQIAINSPGVDVLQ